MTDKTESIRRLMVLAEFLRTVPRKRFNLESWVDDEYPPVLDPENPECGSTACAVGWATTIPEFQALGLYLSVVNGVLFPVFGGWERLHAVVCFFGLTIAEGEHLFFDSSYSHLEEMQGTKVVIERIEELIQKWEDTPETPETEEGQNHDVIS